MSNLQRIQSYFTGYEIAQKIDCVILSSNKRTFELVEYLQSSLTEDTRRYIEPVIDVLNEYLNDKKDNYDVKDAIEESFESWEYVVDEHPLALIFKK